MSLFIHFNLLCNRDTQIRFHNRIRKKLKEWRGSGLVARAVLTYHFNNPPDPDYLQLCLDIPTIEEPPESKTEVSRETLNLIPSAIIEYINKLSSENAVETKVFNYRLVIEAQKKYKEEKHEPYYNGASVEQILRFASVGTRIAVEVLDQLGEEENTWNHDMELSEFIKSRLESEFGHNYLWLDWAWHFVCNPLLLPEGYLTALAASRSNPALKILRKNLVS
jgi:hypothetical protein